MVGRTENGGKVLCMMNYLILILMVVFHTAANAQVPMTTENRSLGPGTYEESMAQINGASPPSDGYKKGWQTSKPSMIMSYSGSSGTVPLLNPNQEVPEE